SPPSISRTPSTTMIPRTTGAMGLLAGWLRRRVRLHDDRRAIRDDLGHVARHLAAVEAHRDDRVGAHERGVVDEPVAGLAARVLEQLGVLVDLAAAERSEAGDEVAREATAADDEPERLALRLDDAMPGDERCGGDDHDRTSVGCPARESAAI